ncbi:MAG: bifunctional 2-C-methyl-D-erythritol 4-phosphate cytidylyltransferase/2-C-methyl-D-erythritol 2,4-cyclodiphosphate synthase, partial [Candidatus Electrothrix sp. ATG2]|nr:bifunctional 2-C-methyl-D-erythritol 4-phosphate cytidylyltransferase/2-C-methyl-D-erythritol 2,4-cyclodiphosphate synthase [Candidatus Electrothrix sp. ATG2]
MSYSNVDLKSVSVAAIIPAAGFGTRMGAAVPKQFIQLAGEPVLVRTLR